MDINDSAIAVTLLSVLFLAHRRWAPGAVAAGRDHEAAAMLPFADEAGEAGARPDKEKTSE